jgi:hypothetical protein
VRFTNLDKLYFDKLNGRCPIEGSSQFLMLLQQAAKIGLAPKVVKTDSIIII